MSRKITDLTGIPIDHGRVIREAGRCKIRGILWECQCNKCGELFIEGANKLNAPHNELNRHHSHKCKMPTKMSTKAAKAYLDPIAGNVAPFSHRSEEGQRRFRIAKEWREKRMTDKILGLIEAQKYARTNTGIY